MKSPDKEVKFEGDKEILSLLQKILLQAPLELPGNMQKIVDPELEAMLNMSTVKLSKYFIKPTLKPAEEKSEDDNKAVSTHNTPDNQEGLSKNPPTRLDDVTPCKTSKEMEENQRK